MDTQKAARIQELTEEIVARMGFEATVDLQEPAYPTQGEFACNIRVEDDSNLLIGQHGVNLQALQHVVRLAARKEFRENIHFSLDVNAYWEEKVRSIGREAKEAAEQALRDGILILLRPMAGHERKIVHMELAENALVVTESVGDGDSRKVSVKPAALA
jgi:spoIIIJ-associated protein